MNELFKDYDIAHILDNGKQLTDKWKITDF